MHSFKIKIKTDEKYWSDHKYEIDCHLFSISNWLCGHCKTGWNIRHILDDGIDYILVEFPEKNKNDIILFRMTWTCI